MQAPTTPPSRAELRKFALIMAGMTGLIFGLLLPWLWGFGWPLWPWAVAALFVVWGILWPAGLNPVYRLWMRFGLAVGWVNSRIILGVVFYLLFTPIGLAMRLAGNDPMRRKLQADAVSYRIQSTHPPPEHLERPY